MGLEWFPKPKDVNDVIYQMINLFLSDKIIDKEKYHDCVGKSDVDRAKWLSDIERFDYSLFDLEWLKTCRAPLLSKICNIEKARKEIIKNYKEAYLKGDISKDITDIIVKYFIDKDT